MRIIKKLIYRLGGRVGGMLGMRRGKTDFVAVDILRELHDFDPDIYLKLNPDVRDAGGDPLKHYIEFGRAENRTYKLDDFDSEVYLKLNEDVREAGIDPLEHFLERGRTENRAYKFPEFQYVKHTVFVPQRQTVLLVTHESSLTGAPVLVYNMALQLSRSLNVVVLSLGAGMLESFFQELEIAYVPGYYARFSQALINHVVGRILDEFDISFAIVNSVESRLVIDPLHQANVPCVALIHEFASCYPDPPKHFKAMMTQPEQIVFSTEITFKDAIRYVDGYDPKKIHILPQGRSDIPRKNNDDDSRRRERQRLQSILRPPGVDARQYLVLGAGSINFRKGVDLFLQCARRILSKVGENRCRFVWIGQGYAPRTDAALSVYLEDQIIRAGLVDAVEIIDETTEIETAYELADLFLLSSRLDPLPNVAIDAMFFGKPVVCFAKTTGIASFLEERGLAEPCVAEYLDVEGAAEKASRLLLAPDARLQMAGKLSAHVAEDFDMARYVEKVAALVKSV